MTEQQQKNSQAMFNIIMNAVKPEEKLLFAGAASRLADAFAQDGFEVVEQAEWQSRGSECFCTNCGSEAHFDKSNNPIKSIRCHNCGARMINGSY